MWATIVNLQPIYYELRCKSLTDPKKNFGWPKKYVAGVKDFQSDDNNQHYSVLIPSHCLADPSVKGCFSDDFFLKSVRVL